MIRTIIILLFLIFSQSFADINAQNASVSDSLLNVLDETNNYEERIDVLNQLCNLHFGDSPQQSYLYAKEIVSISKKNNYTKGRAAGYMQLGRAYTLTGNYEEAFKSFTKAKKNYALLGDINNEASAINSMANVLYMSEKYSEALEFYRQSLVIKKANNDSIGIAIATGNMGECFLGINMPDSALYYAREGLKIEQSLANENGIAISQSSIAYIKYTQGKFREAIEDYQQACEIFIRQNDYYQLAYNYADMAAIYLDIEEYATALPLIQAGMEHARNAQAVNIEIQFLKLYSTYYEKSQNADKALAYFKEYHSLKDSLLSKEKSRQITELQTLYELDNKDNEIKLLAKENAANRTFIISIISVLVLVLVFALIVFKQYLHKRRIAAVLEAQNTEIEAQKAEILTQNEQLELKTKQLQELDEIKSAFFANISHEFRTPLTLIIGPTENILSEINDNRQKIQLQTVKHQAEKLLHLINQLLDLSKIEKHQLQLKPETFNAEKLFRRIWYSFESLAETKKITSKFECRPQNAEITADLAKTETIVSNLISNALKFTDEGGEISLTINQTEDFTEIAISDTGIGIPDSELEKIFQRFYRSSKHDYVQGTGIGLALVKELSELHGGSVTAESRPGKGSRFVVRLPRNLNVRKKTATILEEELPAKKTKASENNLNADDSSSHHNRILIAEDNPDMQNYLHDILGGKFEIRITDNGLQALEILNDYEPDLIISDVMMPKMDGFELTHKIKTNPNYNHIPLILLTAKNTHQDKMKGLQQSADEYITKPFNAEELILRVKNLIKGRALLRSKFEKSIQVNPSEITATSADEQFITKALQLIEEHMDNADYSVETFSSEMGMSRTNLHRKMKALTNRTTSEFMREIRLKRAAQMLKKDTGTVSEIAYAVGFNNLSYFTKCFKQSFGQVPSEYK